MRIAVVGTGAVGRALAGGFAAADHEVVIGTRDPDVTRSRTDPDRFGNPPFEQWQRAHPEVGLEPFATVAAAAQVIVNATSGAASLDALAAIDARDLDRKVLLDVANPLDFSSGGPALFTTSSDSLAERIQVANPRARVVKSLNTVNADVMVDPGMLDGDHVVFVAGNDADAKRTVQGLLSDLGWVPARVHDLGALTAARGMEAWLLLWLDLMGSLGTPHFNLAIVAR